VRKKLHWVNCHEEYLDCFTGLWVPETLICIENITPIVDLASPKREKALSFFEKQEISSLKGR
jgi:hypothetical protein